MVRFSRRKGGAGAAEYYKLDDSGRPSAAHWIGDLAAELKLAGKVAWEAFAKLCDNKHPDTGERLTARHDKNRVAVWDVVILAPKSVSIVGELAGDDRLLQAHLETVREVAAAIEADMRVQISRYGQTGDRVTGNMAGIGVFHPMGRPVKEDGKPDMGWHSHLAIINGSHDKVEGRIKAIHTRQLLQESDYYATVYRSGMAARVTELGYEIRQKGKYWELAGVSDATIKKFSRREQEAEAFKVEHKLTGKRALQAGAMSRSRKKHDLEMPEMREYWAERLTAKEKAGLVELKEKAIHPHPLVEITAPEVKQAWQFARDTLTAKRKPVDAITTKRLFVEVAKDFYGKAKPHQVHEAIEASGLRVKNGMVSKPKPRRSMADRIRRGIYDRIRQSREWVRSEMVMERGWTR